MFYQNPNKNLELASLKRDLEMASRTKSGRVRKKRTRRKQPRSSRKVSLEVSNPNNISALLVQSLGNIIPIPIFFFPSSEKKSRCQEKKNEEPKKNKKKIIHMNFFNEFVISDFIL